MSWRTGSRLFLEMWPLLEQYLTDRDERIRITARLLRVFIDEDMDTWDIEDVDPDIRAAILAAGYEIAEPDRYPDID